VSADGGGGGSGSEGRAGGAGNGAGPIERDGWCGKEGPTQIPVTGVLIPIEKVLAGLAVVMSVVVVLVFLVVVLVFVPAVVLVLTLFVVLVLTIFSVLVLVVFVAMLDVTVVSETLPVAEFAVLVYGVCSDDRGFAVGSVGAALRAFEASILSSSASMALTFFCEKGLMR
jgi:hypothetical protein